MNRRCFISVLTAAMDGLSCAPLIHVPELPERHRWKRMQGSMILIPNPEWVNSAFEAPSMWHELTTERWSHVPPEFRAFRNRLPCRFKLGFDGQPVMLEPFLEDRIVWSR